MKRPHALLASALIPAAALLLPLTAAAAGKPAMPEMQVKLDKYDVKSRDFIFPSGLRIIMNADHSEPLVAITTTFDRGSTADPIGKEGIAHFVEHLWFRSEHGDLPKVWDILSELGCSLNASTASDWTNYMSVCPSSSLEPLLKLESLRLTEAIEGVVDEVVKIEREVVRNELRMRYENSAFMAFPHLFERLYPVGHPYQRLGIGSHGSLNNITLADIQAFVDVNYVPENTTIMVVGDFDIEQASTLIFENFDPRLLHEDLTPDHIQRFKRDGVENPDPENPNHWVLWALDPDDDTKSLDARGKAPVRISGEPPIPPPPADIKPAHVKAAVEYPVVFLAWTFPGAYHGNEGPMGVAAGQAGGLMAAYFRTDRRVRKDPVFGWPEVGCFLWSGKLDSKVICSIEIKDEADGEAIAQKAIDQLSPLWTERFDYDATLYAEVVEPQLMRSKNSELSSVLLSLDLISSLGGRATLISEHAHYTGSAKYHSDLMNSIMELDLTEVQQLAFTYLKRERAVTLVVTPLDEKDQVLDSSNAEYHGARKDDDIIESAIDPALITNAYIRENTHPPRIAKIKEKVLDNGLRVVVMPHGEVPLVQATLLYGGGSAAEPAGLDDWASTFSGDLWSRYDAKYDPLRIAARRIAASGDNYEVEGMKASALNLDGVLWLMRENVEARKPLFEGKADWMSYWRRALKADWNDPAWWSDRLVWQNVAPQHVYSYQPGWDDYDRMSSEWNATVVKSYMNRKYQPANATLLIVGRVDSDAALAAAEATFGGWTPAAGTEIGPFASIPAVPQANPGKVIVFDDPKNTQTDVTFICPIAPGGPKTAAAQTLLGDYLDERAWMILREQSGVTYGAGAGATFKPGGFSYLYLNSLVQNDSSSFAVGAFYDIVAEVSGKKVDPVRLRVLALNQAKKYVLGQQSIEQMTNRLSGAISSGRSWEDLDAWGAQLAAVDVDALAVALGDCADHAVVTLTGPKSVVGPSLEAAGIAYEVIDWKSMRDEMYRDNDPKAYKKMMKARAKKEAEEAEEVEAEDGQTGE